MAPAEIHRRRTLRLPVLALALAISCGSPAPEPAPESLAGTLAGRHVVLIVADALHAHHLGSYGCKRPTSPCMDRLAEAGVRFSEAYSQTSWTVSSVASLFTSLEQERHGLLYATQQLGPEASTMAELFQGAGYRTVALIQNGIIWSHRDKPGWPGTRLCRGFDSYEMFPDMDRVTEETDRLLARAREVLLEKNDRPVFAYLHLVPPHEPYTPPAAFSGRYDPDYEGPVDGSIASSLRVAVGEKGYDRAEDLAHLEALYDEHITYVDAQIGSLLADLQASDSAFLYIVTSDHGEAFREHGSLGHNNQVHEEMVHVPLVLHAPGSALPRGRVLDASTSLLDLLPTLVDLIGLPRPRQTIRGLSLLPLLEAPGVVPEAFRGRPLCFTSRYKKKAPEQLNLALRRGPFKLMRFWNREEDALYNVLEDPGETVDLVLQHPELAARLGRELEAWYDQALRSRLETGGEGAIPQEVLEQLQKMGYFGDR